jgi:hypothetical protein
MHQTCSRRGKILERRQGLATLTYADTLSALQRFIGVRVRITLAEKLPGAEVMTVGHLNGLLRFGRDAETADFGEAEPDAMVFVLVGTEADAASGTFVIRPSTFGGAQWQRITVEDREGDVLVVTSGRIVFVVAASDDFPA